MSFITRRVALAVVGLSAAAFFARARLNTIGGAIPGLDEKFLQRGSPEKGAKKFAHHPPTGNTGTVSQAKPHSIPGVIDDVVIIGSLALLVAALIYAMFKVVDWSAVREWIGEGPAEAVIPDAPQISPDAVREAVARSYVAIDEHGDDRGAVVGSWLALERAAEGGGDQRRSTETSGDFAVRILATHDVPVAELMTLHDLYRRPRYSYAPIGPEERASARSAIDAIQISLAADLVDVS